MAEDAFTLHDFAPLARARQAPETWDLLEGGAGDEWTRRANTEAYDRLQLHPGVLTGAGTDGTATRVLRRTWAAPTAIAPMAHRTKTATRDLVGRAERAGFEALVLTVDAPRPGRRLRDLRNGLRLPVGIAPANLTGDGFGSPGDHALTDFDASLDRSVVTWLRSVSVLPVLVKGVLTAADARHAVEAGVDGMVVSHHGGRQLGGAPATLTVLPEVVAAVDRTCPVLVDGGVRRGRGVLTAPAVGADATLVGRPALHALAADPERGVARMRGTHSVPMRFTGAVPHNHVMGRHGDFRRVTVDVLAPLAHRGWSACRLGTAAGALSRTLRLLRGAEELRRRNLKSELLLTRLSRARRRIDTVRAMRHDHLRHQPLGLERALRDLRSAPLNHGNDRLHLANGSRSLLDQETTLA
ncbi:alpha-hydroxy acid oxidase [Streptomyces sp. R44]|uniref:Alpha-hydroxy acid oxidase n=1 Tax=Streptomyces sp. R44 TaxID=3238633 RepID=A0AB39T6P7_9ACTN